MLDNIHDWQYGVAASMTDFLLSYAPGGPAAKGKKPGKAGGKFGPYRRLIEGIKAGLPWEDALREAYGLDSVQLTRVYGESIGIPDLRP